LEERGELLGGGWTLPILVFVAPGPRDVEGGDVRRRLLRVAVGQDEEPDLGVGELDEAGEELLDVVPLAGPDGAELSGDPALEGELVDEDLEAPGGDRRGAEDGFG
jgi:hypothetical protein